MRKKTNNKVTPIGIDLGTCGVRLAQLAESGGQWSVQALAASSLPASLEVQDDGYMQQAMQLSKKLADSHGFVGKRCVVVLPDLLVQTKNVRMPEMPKQELEQAMAWEAKDRFGFKPGEGVMTRHLVAGAVDQGGEKRMEVLLMASLAEKVEALTEQLLLAGFDPEAIEVCPTVMAYGATRLATRDQVQCMVNVGETATRVVVATDAGPRFYKSIDMGWSHLDQCVSERLGCMKKEAKAMREAVGGNSAFDEPKTQQACEVWLNEWVQELGLCLRYDAVTHRGERAQSVVVASGAAVPQTILQNIESGTGMSVRALAWDESMQMEENSLPGLDGAWQLAIGAAMRPLVAHGVPKKEAA